MTRYLIALCLIILLPVSLCPGKEVTRPDEVHRPRRSSPKVTTKYFENVDINNYDLLFGRLDKICKEKKIGEPYIEILGYLLKQFNFLYGAHKLLPSDSLFFINAEYLFKTQLKYLERIIEFYGDLDEKLLDYRKRADELLKDEDYDKLGWLALELNQFKCPKVSAFTSDVFIELIRRCAAFKFDKAENYANLTIQQLMAKVPPILMIGMFRRALESSDKKEIEKARRGAISLILKHNNRNFDSMLSSAFTFLKDLDYYNDNVVELLLTNECILNATKRSDWDLVNCITKMVINDPPVLEMIKRAYSDSKSSWYKNRTLKCVFEKIDYLLKKNAKEKDLLPDIPERYKLSNYIL